MGKYGLGYILGDFVKIHLATLIDIEISDLQNATNPWTDVMYDFEKIFAFLSFS
jgi:hypothetical protein